MIIHQTFLWNVDCVPYFSTNQTFLQYEQAFSSPRNFDGWKLNIKLLRSRGSYCVPYFSTTKRSSGTNRLFHPFGMFGG